MVATKNRERARDIFSHKKYSQGSVNLNLESVMKRFCYCSQILPGKRDLVKDHWQSDASNREIIQEKDFWECLKMTGFENWLQPTPEGDFLIHCVEGTSLRQIFKRLRKQISSGNRNALGLQKFYQNVLGKDYSLPEVEPQLESLLNLSLPISSSYIKRSFLYPLLSQEEEAHRHFSHEAMCEKRERHEAMMRVFGVSQLSTWLQTTSKEKYIVVYTERHHNTPATSQSRLEQGQGSDAWKEIATILMRHTGLTLDELSPAVEWLT